MSTVSVSKETGKLAPIKRPSARTVASAMKQAAGEWVVSRSEAV